VAPPSSTKSRPGRALAVLLALIVIMLVAIIGKDASHPGHWGRNFHVQLGLDLSSGTTVTLRAVTTNQRQPSSADMATAISIMEARVNGAGFTGAVVQQQGSDIITVAVPGKGSQQVVKLVGTTALLRFRQELLAAPNYASAVPVPAPTPSASPSPSASASAKGKASAKPSPSPSASASTSGAALGPAGSGSGGQSLTARSRQLAAKPMPRASASPKRGGSASPSPSATASPSASPTATQRPPKLATTADGQGNAAALSAPVKALFDKLNCADPNWQKKVYNNDPTKWDNPNSQIVACDASGNKVALAKSTVLGTMVTGASATLSTTSTDWQVNLNFNGAGTKAFGAITSSMFSAYGAGSATNPTDQVLDSLAIVLDGKIVSNPLINQGAIPGGQAQITGNFTQQQATSLANVLSYGALPLTFKNQSTESVSPQLGSSQLHAGLIAAGIGLILVVLYSFFYYRGLGIVSVSSLITAALLTYLSVVLLSKYQGFSLSLAGVAGLIVAIGITADSFVVYFERLRDEVRDGRSLRAAVERGWQRARRTILVSDTVSFLAAALLWYFAIGDVKGFAFTLGLTTVIDVVVVFLFTKPMITILARTKFFGNGHPLSGLDPVRLGARAPWRGAKARVAASPAAGGAASATATPRARTTPKEA
jgi:preprotein translocase subunit SecD